MRMVFQLLKCLKTHYGRQCQPFSGQKCTRLWDFAYLLNLKIFPGVPSQKRPSAWTQIAIYAWLASVPTAPVWNDHCRKTHTHTRTHWPIQEVVHSFDVGPADSATVVVHTPAERQGAVRHVRRAETKKSRGVQHAFAGRRGFAAFEHHSTQVQRRVQLQSQPQQLLFSHHGDLHAFFVNCPAVWNSLSADFCSSDI